MLENGLFTLQIPFVQGSKVGQQQMPFFVKEIAVDGALLVHDLCPD